MPSLPWIVTARLPTAMPPPSACSEFQPKRRLARTTGPWQGWNSPTWTGRQSSQRSPRRDSDLYCNASAERLFGIPAEEALGKDYRTLAGMELADLDRQAIFATVSPQRFWEGEITVTNRNGERRVLDVSDSALRDQSGKLLGIVAILRDITMRRRAEESSRTTQDHLTLAQPEFRS